MWNNWKFWLNETCDEIYLCLHNFSELWKLFSWWVLMRKCFGAISGKSFISLVEKKCKKKCNVLNIIQVPGFCPLKFFFLFLMTLKTSPYCELVPVKFWHFRLERSCSLRVQKKNTLTNGKFKPWILSLDSASKLLAPLSRQRECSVWAVTRMEKQVNIKPGEYTKPCCFEIRFVIKSTFRN